MVAAGGVDDEVGVRRRLVGAGDAGELRDLPAPRLGVEALAVTSLALLDRRGHVHQEERAAGVGDVGPHLLAGGVEGRDGGEDRRTPPWRLISAATQPIRRMLVSRSAWRRWSPADRLRRTTSPSSEVTVRSPRSRITSCSARASVDLPLPNRPVKKTTSPCSPGGGSSKSTTSAIESGSLPSPVTPTTSPVAYAGDDPLAELLVGLGVATRGHRHRHHGGTVQQPRCLERGTDQAHPAQRPPLVRRRARARQGQQHHRLVGGVRLDGAQVLLGQRAGHRDGDSTRVPFVDLVGGEGEPAERAVLVVLEGLDRAHHAGEAPPAG